MLWAQWAPITAVHSPMCQAQTSSKEQVVTKELHGTRVSEQSQKDSQTPNQKAKGWDVGQELNPG